VEEGIRYLHYDVATSDPDEDSNEDTDDEVLGADI
jgi:hypothetical protein